MLSFLYNTHTHTGIDTLSFKRTKNPFSPPNYRFSVSI